MAKAKVQEEVSPNLIPMIDIMFLLLLFFMLGADMGQRELEEVILPKALAVREEKEEAGGSSSDKVVVNVYHDYAQCPAYEDKTKDENDGKPRACYEQKHWKIGIRGHNLTELKKLEAYLMNEANAGRAKPEALSTGKPVTASERPVTIHADAMAPYGQVQEVVNTCAKVGIYKIECGAARPPEADMPGAAVAAPASATN